MFCSKCGAEVSNGSHSCSKCGARIALPKLGLPLIPLLGAVALSVSPFLHWVSERVWSSWTLQGLPWPESASALYVSGALVFLVTILARENERRLSAALAILGALSLGLVFTFTYKVIVYVPPWGGQIPWGDVREGFYVAGVGAFLTALSACPLFRRIALPNGSHSFSKCGTRTGLPKLGLPLIPLLGAAALIVGAFLPGSTVWTLQGLGWPESRSALYVLGALVFLVTILARENDRRLGAALAVLGAFSLALVLNPQILPPDAENGWRDSMEGFYVAGVGAFLTLLSACPLFRRIAV